MSKNITRTNISSMLIILFFTLGSWNLQAQLVIKGLVTEEGNNNPVEFANLGIAGTFIGVATDEQGKFALTIPAEQVGTTLKISAIGYNPLEIIINKENVEKLKHIELKPTSYSINEVSVDAKSLLLYSRIKKAVKSIGTNYNTTPLNMLGDYRETTQTGTNQTNTSGELMVYDNIGYKKQTLAESFKSICYRFNSYKTDKVVPPTRNGLTNIDFLLEMDLVRLQNLIVNDQVVNLYKLVEGKDTVMNGEKVWDIEFTAKNPSISTTGDAQALAFKGHIYIGQTTWAVHRIIFHCSSSFWNLNGKSLYYTTGDYLAKDINYIIETEYTPLNKVFQLKSITLKASYKNSNNVACNEISELNIKSINTSNVQNIEERDYFKE